MSDTPRVWVLRSTGAGATRQLLNLADALGWPYEYKDMLDTPLRAVRDRIYPPALRRIPADKRAWLQPPWPDLVLVSGGRPVADALRIRRLSGGRARLVCVGRPGAPLHWCDLVITTPQYQLPEHPNVLHNLLPLNRPDPEQSAAACREWAPRFAQLPRPWLGLLLGGDSGSYRFTVAAARELSRRLDARARAAQGSLLITSSPRTPDDALDALLAGVSVPSYCHRWRADDRGGNPILAILGLCDALVVTADSASMLAEACATGRPVSVFAPPSRPLAALIERPWLPARLGPARTVLQRLHRSLVIHGLWVPARNMNRLHRALEQRRLVRPIEALTENDNANRQTPDDMERAVAAIHDLFPATDTTRNL